DWIYVEDNCTALDLVLRKGAPGAVYNIGAGNEFANLELTRRVLRLLGKPESLISYVTDRPGHDRRYSVDTTKVRALGWHPRWTFEAALAAHEAGAFLIAISSDYVFDGGASEPYDEDAPVAPLGAYGRSKAAGEGMALDANPGATAIVRSSWIYGRVGKNFVKTMLGLA